MIVILISILKPKHLLRESKVKSEKGLTQESTSISCSREISKDKL
jgi:hypothetical protein